MTAIVFTAALIMAMVSVPAAQHHDPGSSWRSYSSDMNGIVDKTCTDTGICQYRGCLLEEAADGSDVCHVAWLSEHRLEPQYIEPEQRRYDNAVLMRACVFVDTENSCMCRPFWYRTWVDP